MLALPVFADGKTEFHAEDGYTVVNYTNGSCTVITPVTDADSDVDPQRGTITRSKSAYHYESNGSLAWGFTLTATFSYNGSSASCTQASYSKSINNSSWSFSNGSATRSGHTATGRGAFTKKILGITIQTIPVTLTLTCDPNGNVS